jgi:hypothetical protein
VATLGHYFTRNSNVAKSSAFFPLYRYAYLFFFKATLSLLYSHVFLVRVTLSERQILFIFCHYLTEYCPGTRAAVPGAWVHASHEATVPTAIQIEEAPLDDQYWLFKESLDGQ